MAIAPAGEALPQGGYRRGASAATVLMLFVIAVFNYVDRQVFTILLQPIKQELHLSDTQLGLLTGPAFAICFALAGLPLAFLAERRSRKFVILLSLAFWSVCTAAIGLVQTFFQLLAVRTLVAVGEAGSAPASQSLLGDLYPHGRRATPMAFFAASVSVGVLIGLVAGGILDTTFGWRIAFAVVGCPGLALALFFAFALKEPPRSNPQFVGKGLPGAWAGLGRLWSIQPYRGVVIGAALHLIAASALNQWIASYLMRGFSLTTREVGVPLGLMVGCVGAAASVAGGVLADRFGKRRPQWLAWLPSLMMLAGVPLAAAVYFASSFEDALLFLVVPVIAATAYTGPLLAAVQLLAPPGLRAAAVALMMLVGGVLGQGLGPLLVGFFSDQLAPILGAGALRWALLAVTPVSLIAAVVLWRAGQQMSPLRADPLQASIAGGT